MEDVSPEISDGLSIDDLAYTDKSDKASNLDNGKIIPNSTNSKPLVYYLKESAKIRFTNTSHLARALMCTSGKTRNSLRGKHSDRL